ncbi:Type II secretory pathway, component PulJ [Edwardsiella hoshinae]|uniref:Type II secretory pathway, component PulJ n=1 Tax=Edwardsiella hoshinae TaxID=93378 RepID=A0A376DK87_9GAMM|nr:prepilin-type N-terminal cleavage/methylation domain-containing protein [Edwardsiella hoshinae]STC90724.1 Type II secretory pathway, component PulJ [Edwardsiella hoshinae]
MRRAGAAGAGYLQRQRGMSLLSLMLALTLGALVLSAALRLVGELRRQGLAAQREQQRSEEGEALLARVEKDVQRSGFCASPCRRAAPPLQIAAVVGEAPASCVLLAYDLDGDGRVTQTERFGWRLRQGALETRRGATACQGSGWERVSDQSRWRVSTLTFRALPGGIAITLALAERERGDPPWQQSLWLATPNRASGARR